MKTDKDLENTLRNLKERVHLIEASYNPGDLNLHFDILVRADPALFETLLTIGQNAWNVIQINQSWEASYLFYDLFQLISGGSGRIRLDNTQKCIPENVIVQLALLLIESLQMTTDGHGEDIYKRNMEALGSLLLTFNSMYNLENIVMTRAKEMNNDKVINHANWLIERVRQMEKDDKTREY